MTRPGRTLGARIRNLIRLPPKTEHVEEVEDLTDEVEKSLWELKSTYDLDTEEVSMSIEGYRQRHAPANGRK